MLLEKKKRELFWIWKHPSKAFPSFSFSIYLQTEDSNRTRLSLKLKYGKMIMNIDKDLVNIRHHSSSVPQSVFLSYVVVDQLLFKFWKLETRFL